MSASQKVLIVDDDASLAEALKGLLEFGGYRVEVASQTSTALEAVRRGPTDLALIDLRLGQESGLQLLSQLKEIRPEMSVIMITGLAKIEDAVEAMKLGADNFVTKPIDPERLLTLVKKGFENRGLRYKTIQLERLNRPQIRKILGNSGAIKEMLALADAVADRDTTVLLRGETGSGKGLLAQHIHNNSPRRPQAFVELNCAGLQRDLTESELFGHEKGAFTGAVERKIGLFEAADDGTLFLDEIGEMDLSVQAKLLKVLEQKRFRRIGGTTEIEVDVRIIAATHRDLTNDVAEGKFREDLFYRLNVFTIPIPSLRQRTEDIVPLALEFLSEFRGSSENQKLSKEAIQSLESYAWPGNVRELRNVMERAAILCPANQEIGRQHLPSFGARSASNVPAPTRMEDAERNLFEAALKSNHYNLKAAAADLGISRGTLYRKIKKYNIPIEE